MTTRAKKRRAAFAAEAIVAPVADVVARAADAAAPGSADATALGRARVSMRLSP